MVKALAAIRSFSPLRAEGQGSKGSKAKGNRPGEAKAKGAAAAVGRVAVVIRRPAAPSNAVPVTTAYHPVRAIFFIQIPVPLPDVA